MQGDVARHAAVDSTFVIDPSDLSDKFFSFLPFPSGYSSSLPVDTLRMQNVRIRCKLLTARWLHIRLSFPLFFSFLYLLLVFFSFHVYVYVYINGPIHRFRDILTIIARLVKDNGVSHGTIRIGN